MATASTEMVTIVPAVEAVVETVVTLKMSEVEARTLVAALRKISGPPNVSPGVRAPRGVLTEDILPALTRQVGKWNFNHRVDGMNIREGAQIEGSRH